MSMPWKIWKLENCLNLNTTLSQLYPGDSKLWDMIRLKIGQCKVKCIKPVKGTVSVISSDLSSNDISRLTMVPFKPLSHQICGGYNCFPDSKHFNSDNISIAS